MSIETAAQLITAEAFLAMPHVAHGGKMELIRGRVVTHMPVGGPHGEVASLVSFELLSFVRPRQLGSVGVEVGFVLSRDPDTVRAPDVHFVRASRLPGGRMPRGFFEGPPDLAVEVVSPDDTDSELATKLSQYFRAGVLRAWVVRPELQTVTVHYPDGNAHTFEAGATLSSHDAGFEVDGFALDVASLFESVVPGD